MIKNIQGKIDPQNPKLTTSIVKNTPKSSLKFSQKVLGDLWCVVTFSNPTNRKNRQSDFMIFQEESKKHRLNLIIVELAYDGLFKMKKTDAEIVVQINCGKNNTVLRGEEIFNIGLKHVPLACRNVMWLDCDDIFVDKQSTKNEWFWLVTNLKIKKGRKKKGEKIEIFLTKIIDVIEYLAKVFNIMDTDQSLTLASRIKFKIKISQMKIRNLMLLDVRGKYINFLGLVGRQIKSQNPKIYFILKKYFPDR